MNLGGDEKCDDEGEGIEEGARKLSERGRIGE